MKAMPVGATSIANEGRDLVLRYSGEMRGHARLEIGRIIISVSDDRNDIPKVTINWPGCGDQGTTSTAAFVADLGRACAIALAAEQALAEEWSGE